MQRSKRSGINRKNALRVLRWHWKVTELDSYHPHTGSTGLVTWATGASSSTCDTSTSPTTWKSTIQCAFERDGVAVPPIRRREQSPPQRLWRYSSGRLPTDGRANSTGRVPYQRTYWPLKGRKKEELGWPWMSIQEHGKRGQSFLYHVYLDAVATTTRAQGPVAGSIIPEAGAAVAALGSGVLVSFNSSLNCF